MVNTYVLGSKPELIIETTNIAGNLFIPVIARLSIQGPDGTITTVSGGSTILDGDLITNSGYLSYLYEPEEVGWYEYESAVEDVNGRKDAATNGFEVIDRVY